MPDPIPTPAAQISGAQIKQKQREDAIKAAAVKVGIAKGRSEILTTLGVQTLEEASKLHTMQRQHADELERMRHMVGGRAWWRGIAVGLSFSIIGICGGVWAGYAVAQQAMMTLVAADRARTARAALPADIEPMSPPYELNAREPRDAP